MTPFAERIRVGFEDVKRAAGDMSPSDLRPEESALCGLTWDDIARLPRDTIKTAKTAQLDRVLSAIVRSYRAGQRSIWGPTLLEMLAPALTTKVAVTVAKSPAIDDEDIEQQYVLEILRAAAKIPLRAESRWINRRILLRAERCVLRWVNRVTRAGGDPIEDHAHHLPHADEQDDLDQLRDVFGDQLPKADLVVVHRFYVRGEPIERLAGEAGVPAATMFTRIWRIRERLRREREELRPVA